MERVFEPVRREESAGELSTACLTKSGDGRGIELKGKTTVLLKDRTQAVGANALLAGCVAVAVYGVVGTLAWILNGASPDALDELGSAVPVIFTIMAGLRGFGGLFYKSRPGPVQAVITDIGMGVVGLVVIAAVGSIYGSSDYALYSVAVMTPFALAAVVIVSVVIEIVARRSWLIGGSIAVAGIAGIISLGTYAVSAFT